MAIEQLKHTNKREPDVLDMTVQPGKKQVAHNASIMVEDSEATIPGAITVEDKPVAPTTLTGGKRQKVSISDIMGGEQPDVRKPGNPYVSDVNKASEDILDLDKPDSPFNKMLDRKVNEYNERMNEEEERVREAVENGELEADGEIAKSWLGDPDAKQTNTVRTADIEFDDEDEDDLDSDDLLLEEDTEEENEEDMKNVVLGNEPVEMEEEEVVEEKQDSIEDFPGVTVYDASKDIEEPEEEEDNDFARLVKDNPEEEVEEDYEDEEEEEPMESLDDLDFTSTSKKSELKDEDEEEEEENKPEGNDDLVDKLKKMATEKLNPANNVIDISNFQIGKATVKNINPILSVKEDKVVKWVLINREEVVLMREFTGVELQTITSEANNNSATSFSKKMRMIYNHIESPKPDTFEAWLKSTPLSDMDHYYFAVYVASFNGANYIPVDCKGGTKCIEGTFVSDDVPVMDMVKFKDAAMSKKFKKIYKEEVFNNNVEGKFAYNVVPINENIAIGFREPMLYDYMVTLSVDDTTFNKYGSVINLAPYIEDFYAIDQQRHELNKISYTEYPGNTAKTFRSKIRKYNTILSYLTPDQYSLVEAYANNIRTKDDGVTYIIPKLTCPYCGTESEEAEMTGEALVFTRYQLGALVNTTLK